MSAGRSAERPPSRPSEPGLGELGHGAPEVAVVVDDLHRPPAEHVRRPHEHRIPDRRFAMRERIVDVGRGAAVGLRDAERACTAR